MKELESLTGVGREAVRFYIKQGILPPPDKPKKNVAHYSEEHVLRIKVLEHWRQILSMGYDQGAGYDLQFLKRYVDMSRALAEQEVSLFFKEFSSLPVKQAAKLGSEGIKIGNNLIGLLHTREVRKCVQQFVKRQSNENSKT